MLTGAELAGQRVVGLVGIVEDPQGADVAVDLVVKEIFADTASTSKKVDATAGSTNRYG